MEYLGDLLITIPWCSRHIVDTLGIKLLAKILIFRLLMANISLGASERENMASAYLDNLGETQRQLLSVAPGTEY